MILASIAAMSRNGVIGKEGGLPWKLKGDMAFFRQKTMDKIVILGRTTYESIGRPLPGRRLAVLSRSPHDDQEGVRWFTTLPAVLDYAAGEQEVMVAGGEEIYRLLLPLMHIQYLTEIDADIEGDAFYPSFDRSQWRETERISGAADSLQYSLVTYSKKDSTPGN